MSRRREQEGTNLRRASKAWHEVALVLEAREAFCETVYDSSDIRYFPHNPRFDFMKYTCRYSNYSLGRVNSL